MIHIVNAANRSLYAEQIAQMHRIRKTIFVDQLGWSGPTVRGDMEFDVYDDDLAEYLLGLDPETGAVRAGVRMRPAYESSMLADVWPSLVTGGRERVLGPDVWEGTRLFADPNARTDQDKRLTRLVAVAMVEFGLLRGYTRFTGLGDIRNIPRLRNGSWITEILGPPVANDEGEWFAFEARVDAEALARSREFNQVSGSVLVELAPHSAQRLRRTA